MSKKVIVWFRNDLRLHDNEALIDAIEVGHEVYPVYIFDERIFKGKTRYGFAKTAKYRAKFTIESVQDLKSQLQKMGSDLYIRIGKPEEEIFNLANEIKSNWIFCNRERTQEEVAVQDALEQNLWSIGQEIRYSRGKMLYYTADLPFPVTHTPDSFTQFKKEVERYVPIREPLLAPNIKFKARSVKLDYGFLPTLSHFGHSDFGSNDKGGFNWIGGESEALRQVDYYFSRDLVEGYKNSRSSLLGRDFSTKFSPWLAHGCLSPKLVYQHLIRYEKEKKKSKSTQSLMHELLWRDFFRLMGKKHGSKIFKIGGPREAHYSREDNDIRKISSWRNGRTGIPFVDANMRELNNTGFLSNTGRQNVASYLIKELKLDWRIGAEYFESLLIDYDPCSNYGNWNYIAGVASDHKEERLLNVQSQAKRHDADASFTKYWIPELDDIPSTIIHSLDELDTASLSKYKLLVKDGYSI